MAAIGRLTCAAPPGIPLRITLNELKAAAKHLKQETGLNLLPALTRLAQSRHLVDGVLHL